MFGKKVIITLYYIEKNNLIHTKKIINKDKNKHSQILSPKCKFVIPLIIHQYKLCWTFDNWNYDNL